MNKYSSRRLCINMRRHVCSISLIIVCNVTACSSARAMVIVGEQPLVSLGFTLAYKEVIEMKITIVLSKTSILTCSVLW